MLGLTEGLCSLSKQRLRLFILICQVVQFAIHARSRVHVHIPQPVVTLGFFCPGCFKSVLSKRDPGRLGSGESGQRSLNVLGGEGSFVVGRVGVCRLRESLGVVRRGRLLVVSSVFDHPRRRLLRQVIVSGRNVERGESRCLWHLGPFDGRGLFSFGCFFLGGLFGTMGFDQSPVARLAGFVSLYGADDALSGGNHLRERRTRPARVALFIFLGPDPWSFFVGFGFRCRQRLGLGRPRIQIGGFGVGLIGCFSRMRFGVGRVFVETRVFFCSFGGFDLFGVEVFFGFAL